MHLTWKTHQFISLLLQEDDLFLIKKAKGGIRISISLNTILVYMVLTEQRGFYLSQQNYIKIKIYIKLCKFGHQIELHWIN